MKLQISKFFFHVYNGLIIPDEVRKRSLFVFVIIFYCLFFKQKKMIFQNRVGVIMTTIAPRLTKLAANKFHLPQ